jgi:plasmid stability protein
MIRDLPPELHERLREEARRHHRSMNGEILAILEKELEQRRRVDLPPPVQALVSVDGRDVADAIRRARDGRS